MAGIEDLQRAASHTLLCAINEGDMYATWCDLARKAADFETWSHTVRKYCVRLRREGRQPMPSLSVIEAATIAIRYYYTQHTKEST